MAALRGITWDHPRGYRGLEAATRSYTARDGCEIAWDLQPLAAFEARPIAELAERYDLVVFDHPFVGDIASSRCFVDLTGHADAIGLAGLPGRTVGRTLESYRYDGLWGLPIDAACHVAAYRASSLKDDDLPRTAAAIEALCRRGVRCAIALGGVHALMAFYTVALQSGIVPGADGTFVGEAAGKDVLGILDRVASWCPDEAKSWNSIQALDAMVRDDSLVYCPLVFGFSAYAGKSGRERIEFAAPPRLAGTAGEETTILGGTGLGISTRCRHRDLALRFASFLMTPEAQLEMGMAGGQPAATGAWEDRALNRAFGGFFERTRPAIDAAWVRPRMRGYIGFQENAGHVLQRYLCGDIERTLAVRALNDRFGRLAEATVFGGAGAST